MEINDHYAQLARNGKNSFLYLKLKILKTKEENTSYVVPDDQMKCVSCRLLSTPNLSDFEFIVY